MRDTLGRRITTATTAPLIGPLPAGVKDDDRPMVDDLPTLAVITDETTALIMGTVDRTARALARGTSMPREDREDITATAGTLAILRTARCILAGEARDAGLIAREETRASVTDYWAQRGGSREIVSALDWTGDDGATRDALTAKVRSAEDAAGTLDGGRSWTRWDRRDALDAALDDCTDVREDDDTMPAGIAVRRILRALPGDDGRCWRGTDGYPSVVPALDALGLPSSGRRRHASVVTLDCALVTVAIATREVDAGWRGTDRAGRWTDRAVTWSEDARRRCQYPHLPTAPDADRFEGVASRVVVTAPMVGPLPVDEDARPVVHWTRVEGRPVILSEDGAVGVLALADEDARPVTDRASDRAALALAPMAGVRAPSSRKGKRGGGVGGPTLPAGWSSSWAERRV